MQDKILGEIESTSTAKEKSQKCSDAIQAFISRLSPSQLENYWSIENLVVDYSVYIRDAIFKRLL